MPIFRQNRQLALFEEERKTSPQKNVPNVMVDIGPLVHEVDTLPIEVLRPVTHVALLVREKEIYTCRYM